MGFEYDLRPQIQSAIESLEYTEPTDVQKQVIPAVLRGESIAARARTGSGKTAAFLIPTLNFILANKRKEPQLLILVPTLELAAQVSLMLDAFCRFCKKIDHCNISGPMTQAQIQNGLGNVDIIVAVPESLIQPLKYVGKDYLKQLRFLVLDEADLLLTAHLQDIKMLLPLMPPGAALQSILLSATLTREISDLASRLLNFSSFVDVPDLMEVQATHKYISFENDHERFVSFVVIFKQKLWSAGKTIVFVHNVVRAFRLRLLFDLHSVPCAVLDPDAPRLSRLDAIRKFGSVLFVPDASLERGIDLPDVSCVVNFDFPKNLDSYTHRAGRTARAGRPGLVLSFYTQGLMLDTRTKINNDCFEEVREKKGLSLLEYSRELVQNMRYRVEDTLRSITRAAIKNARTQDLKNEVLNSEKLKSHFEDHQADFKFLQNHEGSTFLRQKMKHLGVIPDYLVPKDVTIIPPKKLRKKRKKGFKKRKF